MMIDTPAEFAETAADEIRNRPSPFKFLDPYGPEDGALFFGRDFEIDELYTRLFSGPVTVVYGESGTGKTSLIQCGLRNRVPVEDMLFLTVRMQPNPETALRQELLKTGMAGQAEPGEDLDALLQRVVRRSYKTVLLVLDQFEEFFLFQTEAVRHAFVTRISGWLAQGFDLRIIIAIREEYLAHLGELEQALPGLYENRLWLRRMSRAQAQEAINGPCRVADIAVEPELVDELLSALSVGGHGVELPILQVVLDKLFRQTAADPASESSLSLQGYRRLGEVRSILARFVDDRLASYQTEAESARQVLKAMVTAEGTRRLATPAEIAERLPAFDADFSEEGLLILLKRLVDDRILREDADGRRYELRHDALAAHIRHWMSGLEGELVEIRQVLENRLQEFHRRGRLLEAEVLSDLAPYEHRLRLTGELAELVLRSKSEAVRKRRLRQRIVGAVAAAFLVVVAVLGAIGYILWREADENSRTAKHIIDEYLTQESDDLVNKPKMEPKRKRLLADAKNFYLELSQQHSANSEVRGELADAFMRLAEVNQLLEKNDEAKADYRQSIAAHEALIREEPDNADHLNDLEMCYIKLARLLPREGSTTEAESLVKKALEIGEPLVQQHPHEAKYQKTLAAGYASLSRLKQRAGRGAEAETIADKARSIREQIAKEHPDQPEYQQDLARSLSYPGVMQQPAGSEGEANLLEAIAIQKKLSDEHPEVPDNWHGLARAYNNLAKLKQHTGKLDQAKDYFQKAIESRISIAENHSDVPNYRRGLAQSYNDLGVLQMLIGKNKEAKESLTKSLKLREQLKLGHSDDPRNQSDIAVSHANLGILLREIGDGTAAGLNFQKAIDIGDDVIKEHPGTPEFLENYAKVKANLGILQRDNGSTVDAGASLREARDIFLTLQKQQPDTLGYQNNLAMIYNNLGRLEQGTGLTTQAEEDYRNAINLAEPLVQQYTDVPEYQNRLAFAYTALGRLRQSLAIESDAQSLYEKAGFIGERLRRDNPNVPDYQRNLALTYNFLGTLQQLAGHSSQADETYAKALAIRKRLVQDYPDMPSYQSDLAQILTNVGRMESIRGNSSNRAANPNARTARH